MLRLKRLIEVKQRNVKSSQLQLHRKRQELAKQLERLQLYREEYVKSLMASNIAPLQMDDIKHFLQQLETSIADTKLALHSQSQSEEELLSLATTLDSQQKSVETRLGLAAYAAQSVEDNAVSVSVTSPYNRSTLDTNER